VRASEICRGFVNSDCSLLVSVISFKMLVNIEETSVFSEMPLALYTRAKYEKGKVSQGSK